MSIQEVSGSNASDAFRDVFQNVGLSRSREVINVLVESPFFYRDDDVDLFGLLKRRRRVFEDFFETFFGWDLYVDNQVARLIKPKTYNDVLKPSQRHIFRLSGRHEYVIFVLLLEFHQVQADEQNIDLDNCDEVRFVLGDFIDFVFKRYKNELGEDSGITEEKILDVCRKLFNKLQQYRFIDIRQVEGRAAEDGLRFGFSTDGKNEVLYALLPGLRCYRAEALTKSDLNGKTVDQVDVAIEKETDVNEMNMDEEATDEFGELVGQSGDEQESKWEDID